MPHNNHFIRLIIPALLFSLDGIWEGMMVGTYYKIV
jgi:hypothetical protein